MPSKKKAATPPAQKSPPPFCSLSMKLGANEFTVSGPEEFVEEMRQWFVSLMEEQDERHQKEAPGGDSGS
jgi:hypothetical protein